MSHAISKSMNKTDEYVLLPSLNLEYQLFSQCHNHHCTVQHVGLIFSSKNKPCARWAGTLHPNFTGK